MSSTEDRLKKLAQENLNLGHEPDFNVKFSESDVSSVDAVAFIKVVNSEFNITIPPADVAQLETLGSLADYIEQNAG